MNEWRYLDFIVANGAMQMALDEAIMIASREGKVPNTVRFYAFKEPVTTIGCHQDASEIKKPFVRRMTGGSAVFHNNDFTYSVVMRKKTKFFDEKDYYYIGNMILEGLKEMGVEATYSGKKYCKKDSNCYLNESPYDIEVEGKKISGNAQTTKGATLLQQGTIILNNSKIALPDRNMDVVVGKMKVGFQKHLEKNNCFLKKGRLTRYEKRLAEQLYKEKYVLEKN